MTDKLKHKLTNGTATILFRGGVTLFLSFISSIAIKGCGDWDEIKANQNTIRVQQEISNNRIEALDKRLYNVERATYFGKTKNETN